MKVLWFQKQTAEKIAAIEKEYEEPFKDTLEYFSEHYSISATAKLLNLTHELTERLAHAYGVEFERNRQPEERKPGSGGHNKDSSKFIYEGKTIQWWAAHNGVMVSLIRNRLKRGWTPEKAFTMPIQKKHGVRNLVNKGRDKLKALEHKQIINR